MLYIVISIIAWIVCTVLFIWAYKEGYTTRGDIIIRYIILIFLTVVFLYKGGVIE